MIKQKMIERKIIFPQGKLKPREDRKVLGTDKEMLSPQSSFYN